MAEKVKVRCDPDGSFLEVQFKDVSGFMRPTAVHEQVGGMRHHRKGN